MYICMHTNIYTTQMLWHMLSHGCDADGTKSDTNIYPLSLCILASLCTTFQLLSKHRITTLQQIEHEVVIAFVYTHTQTNTILSPGPDIITIPSLKPLTALQSTCPCQRLLLCPAGNRPPGGVPILSFHHPSISLS